MAKNQITPGMILYSFNAWPLPSRKAFQNQRITLMINGGTQNIRISIAIAWIARGDSNNIKVINAGGIDTRNKTIYARVAITIHTKSATFALVDLIGCSGCGARNLSSTSKGSIIVVVSGSTVASVPFANALFVAAENRLAGTNGANSNCSSSIAKLLPIEILRDSGFSSQHSCILDFHSIVR
jgi:hypothetical protein